MCGGGLCDKDYIHALFAIFFVMLITSHHWRNVFGGLPALQMAQGSQHRSLAMSCARLLGWLACDGFQTLLVLMMLSAGQ